MVAKFDYILDRVNEGYAWKLDHMWHGPFRVIENCEEHAVRLEVQGTPYRLIPLVHISKLKLVRDFPDRPVARLEVEETERVDLMKPYCRRVVGKTI